MNCLICETSLHDAEPGEATTNGMHNFCVMSDVIGHEYDACRCNPEMTDWTVRQIAIEAGRRIRARRKEHP